MKSVSIIWVWIKRLLLLYLLYVVVFSIVIYYIPKHVTTTVEPSSFYQEDIGPDEIALVEHPQDAFSRRVELIRSAKQNLDVCYHNLKAGQTADCFIGELIMAADRGVHVRLLLDGTLGGLSGEHKDLELALCSHPNVEYRPYNPVNLIKPWDFNVMLHDKFIIVDDAMLMLGGRNIGDEYFDPPMYEDAVTNDRDVVIINTRAHTEKGKNSVIYEVQNYMEELWNSDRTVVADKLSKAKEEKGKQVQQQLRELCKSWQQRYPEYYLPKVSVKSIAVPTNKVTLLHNPLDGYKKEPVIGATLARLLQDCKEVTIQTPYATANRHTLQELQTMTTDANVTMLTNSMASSPNYPAFSNYVSQRKKFLQTGIDIYEYQSTDSIHGKSCIGDDRLAVVGSFNLDDRSLYIDTESVLVVDSVPFQKQLKQEMQTLLDHSARVMENNTYDTSDDVKILDVSKGKKCLMTMVSIFSRIFQCLI